MCVTVKLQQHCNVTCDCEWHVKCLAVYFYFNAYVCSVFFLLVELSEIKPKFQKSPTLAIIYINYANLHLTLILNLSSLTYS